MAKTIVVLGAGPGIGYATAALFGKNGYSVALVGRSKEKLQDLSAQLSSANVQSSFYVADLTVKSTVEEALKNIIKKYGQIDVIHYNAAAMRETNILNETADSLINDFKLNVAGLLTVVQATKNELEKTKGAILVTGGGLSMYPHPDYASLSVGKAAVRNLVGSLSQALAPKGVFVGIVTVKGWVKPESEIHNPSNIGAQFWKLNAERNQLDIEL